MMREYDSKQYIENQNKVKIIVDEKHVELSDKKIINDEEYEKISFWVPKKLLKGSTTDHHDHRLIRILPDLFAAESVFLNDIHIFGIKQADAVAILNHIKQRKNIFQKIRNENNN